MTPAPRDSKGRFVKAREPTKTEDFDCHLWGPLVLCVGCLCALLIGANVGYHNGYPSGLVDAQPAIYQHGFDAGVQHQIRKEKITDDTSKWQTTDRYCNRVSKNSIWMRCDLEVV